MEQVDCYSYFYGVEDWAPSIGLNYYVTDLAAQVWAANMMMYIDQREDRLFQLGLFKSYVLSAYGWNTTNEEL